MTADQQHDKDERDGIIDAVERELGLPAGSWRIAGCNVLAHYVRDLRVNAESAMGKLSDLIMLCKQQGMQVTMFEGPFVEARTRAGTTPAERKPSAETPGKLGTEAQHHSALPESGTPAPTGDTPRMDAGQNTHFPNTYGAAITFARQLGRELAEARATIKAHEAVRDACFEALPECQAWGEVPGHIEELKRAVSTRQPRCYACTPERSCWGEAAEPCREAEALSATGRSE